MNYLQLVQRLHYEARIQGAAPSSVHNQTGMSADLARWIDAAYIDIQSKHDGWNFLRADFSKSTVADQQVYTLADWSLTALRKWSIDDVRLYSAYTDEGWLSYLPWETFRMTYLYGSSRSDTGRPTVFSIKPDKSMILYPTPSAVFTVNGEYWRQPVSLVQANSTADNTETPLFDASKHMAIVWRALMFYGAAVGADDMYSHGQNEFESVMLGLEREDLQPLTWGSPLV